MTSICSFTDKVYLVCTSFSAQIILGSDLVYDAAGAQFLPKIIARFVEGNSRAVFYAHTFHRYDDMDVTFMDNLQKEGLKIAEIPFDVATRTMGQPTCVEDNFFEELFPEKRLAILFISSAKD